MHDLAWSSIQVPVFLCFLSLWYPCQQAAQLFAWHRNTTPATCDKTLTFSADMRWSLSLRILIDSVSLSQSLFILSTDEAQNPKVAPLSRVCKLWSWQFQARKKISKYDRKTRLKKIHRFTIRKQNQWIIEAKTLHNPENAMLGSQESLNVKNTLRILDVYAIWRHCGAHWHTTFSAAGCRRRN